MFRPEVATAMAVYFLMHTLDCKINDLVLMKLMVISERECMAKTTSLISGSKFVSMQNGPVLSEVLDLMVGKTYSPIWNNCVGFVRYSGPGSESNHCILKKKIDVEEYLSEFEINLLEEVWNRFRDKQKWEIVDISHEFPEWDRKCAEEKTSSPIPYRSIFELGLCESPEVADSRASEIEYFEAVSG